MWAPVVVLQDGRRWSTHYIAGGALTAWGCSADAVGSEVRVGVPFILWRADSSERFVDGACQVVYSDSAAGRGAKVSVRLRGMWLAGRGSHLQCLSGRRSSMPGALGIQGTPYHHFAECNEHRGVCGIVRVEAGWKSGRAEHHAEYGRAVQRGKARQAVTGTGWPKAAPRH